MQYLCIRSGRQRDYVPITRIDPPIPVLTPDGTGYAHFLIDYSQEHHLMWVVFLDNSGQCWTYENYAIRIQNNPTLGRRVDFSSFAPLTKKLKSRKSRK
jgi:hypothetical protein